MARRYEKWGEIVVTWKGKLRVVPYTIYDEPTSGIYERVVAGLRLLDRRPADIVGISVPGQVIYAEDGTTWKRGFIVVRRPLGFVVEVSEDLYGTICAFRHKSGLVRRASDIPSRRNACGGGFMSDCFGLY